jgi:hypothetical protein
VVDARDRASSQAKGSRSCSFCAHLYEQLECIRTGALASIDSTSGYISLFVANNRPCEGPLCRSHVPYMKASRRRLCVYPCSRIHIWQNANGSSGSDSRVARLHRGGDRPGSVTDTPASPRLPSLNLNWERSVGSIVKGKQKILGWSLERKNSDHGITWGRQDDTRERSGSAA